MGASKLTHYSNTEIQRALIGRAIAHPARIRIIEHLKKGEFIRPIDLTDILQLNPASVHNHLKKLISAELVTLKFNKNAYVIELNHAHLNAFLLNLEFSN